jgi:periplasmic divalent cation tolerance protein
MAATDVLLVLTTLPGDADGAAWGRPLVEARLAACVSLLPGMTSVYRWQDGVSVDREQQVVIKTTADRLEAVRAWISGHHPYELPELLVLPVSDGGAAYLAWVTASTREGADPA